MFANRYLGPLSVSAEKLVTLEAGFQPSNHKSGYHVAARPD